MSFVGCIFFFPCDSTQIIHNFQCLDWHFCMNFSCSIIIPEFLKFDYRKKQNFCYNRPFFYIFLLCLSGLKLIDFITYYCKMLKGYCQRFWEKCLHKRLLIKVKCFFNESTRFCVLLRFITIKTIKNSI